MKHAWAVRAVLWPVVLICGSFSAAQVTINVPANQPTIQAGIDAAANGDTVLVAPGIYFENINFKGKAITLKSSGGASATTIDGTNKASVVTFNTAETRASVLDGFTITHGYDFFNGGGVSISGASPTVQNNIITGNLSVWGLGVHITGGSPLIKSNNVTGNTVSGGSSGEPGGGIGLLGADNPQIIGNTISNNQMPGGGFGGGIGVNGNAGLISGNTITGNYVYNGGGGIQVFNSTTGMIVNNIVAGNRTGGAGFGRGADDGVAISVPSGNQGVSFVNNTLIDNALYVEGFDTSTQVQNNLIYISTAQVPLTCGTYPGQIPVLKNNDFYSTSGTANGGLCGSGVIGTNGNLSIDPLFVNSASDFHLTSNSPAIDAGLNTGVTVTQDLDGSPRFMVGPNNCSVPGIVDMGAYEFQSTITGVLSPVSLGVGQVPLGTGATTSFPVHLQNTGVTCAGPLVFHFSNPDFSVGSTNCATSLASGLSCDVYVNFAPSVHSLESSTMTVTGSFSSPVNVVSLSGQGVAAVAGGSPTSWDFGLGVLSTPTTAKTFTITNSGDYPLQVSDASVTGDFTVTGYTCGAAVAPGNSCTVSAAFTATALALRNGTLTIQSDSFGGDVLIGLQGTGIAGDFIISSPTQPQTVPAGHAAMYEIDTTPIGPAAAIVLSCSGLPSGATCSFNPGSVTSGNSSIMTINSLAATSTAPLRARIAKVVFLNAWVLGIPYIVTRRRRTVAAWSVILLCILGMAACGGAGSDSKSRDHGHAGTPPGSYVVTVTGTLGSVTHSTTVRLNIN